MNICNLPPRERPERRSGIVRVGADGVITQIDDTASTLLGGNGLALQTALEPGDGGTMHMTLPDGRRAGLEAWPLRDGGVLLLIDADAPCPGPCPGCNDLSANANCGIYRTTMDGRLVSANAAMARLHGYGTEQEYLRAVEADPVDSYVDPDRLLHFHRMMTMGGGVRDFVSEIYRHRNREKVWVTENAWYANGPGGVPQFIEGIVQDATARVDTMTRIERQANMDVLTGTASRFRFLTELEEITRAGGRECVLLSIDLDRFKEVNDHFGHGAGDTVLRTVAARLEPLAAKDALLARLGGDEFAMLLTGRHCHMKADVTAMEIVKSLRQPIEIGGHRCTVGASVGVAIFPAQAADAEELLTHADLALYQVKSTGRNGFRIFDQEMRVRLDRRKTLEAELRAAIPGEELELYYQPIVDAVSTAPVSFEALMRWNHPRRGFLPPAQFMQVAEDAGLMTELGNWAIRRACRQAVLLPRHLRVAVNVSPNQFRSDGIVNVVKEALAETGLEAGRLMLEVTETAILSGELAAARLMDELLELGVGLALDDFGTGYSSLSYLQRFAFSKVKIDRSFVAGMEKVSANLAIIRAVIGLAHDLGLEVVAEGIETARQADMLRTEGCNLLQGYLYGKPMPFTDIITEVAVAGLRQSLPLVAANDDPAPSRRSVHKGL